RPGGSRERIRSAPGEPNAQAQDQIRGQEALPPDRDRQGGAGPRLQAPHDDQAHQQADSAAARHYPDVAVGRENRQEMDALRLNGSNFRRSEPWPASSGASPPMPSTRRSSKPPRAIMAGARTPSGSPSRRSSERSNMPTATASAGSGRSGR